MHDTSRARRAALGALLAALHLCAAAEEALPDYLTGFWGTAASLYAGTAKQVHFHIRADGYGIFAGSSSPGIRADGVDDGKPAPRAIIGFPFKATLEGEALIVHPFLPGQKLTQKQASLVITCRYEAEGPSLTCAGPDPKEPAMIMSRQSEAIPAGMEEMIERTRSAK